ncbi:hypothetical protein [Roseibium sp. MMSF_3412]|uniref:hypothetical protein n=1 Tax=Roseibium sp. MMSF_3412 TaxID=3046712 RepID=UPI00273E44C2|nr:hypothetical protein [Roseibium sp. MMSF_3412]
MKKLIAILFVFAFAAPAIAEEKKPTEPDYVNEYYTLDVYRVLGKYAIFKDPREGVCLLRFWHSEKLITIETNLEIQGERGVSLSFWTDAEKFDDKDWNEDEMVMAIDGTLKFIPSLYRSSEDGFGANFFFSLEKVEDFVAPFRSGSKLVVNFPEVFIGVIPLTGTNKAMNTLEKCQSELDEALKLKP